LCSGTGVCELDTPPTATIKLSSTTGQLIVNTRWCNDSAPNQNNDSCISQQTWVTVGELSRGKWNDFRIETKQSAEADAYIRVYMNSVLIYERIDYPTSYDIPKKFKDSGGYQLMYGPYNCCSDYPELDPNQVFYYDNLMWSITEGSSDTDGDGYTTLEGDCDDTDSSIYPGATEIAGDGIDQDCNGVDETSIGNLIIINPDLSFSIPDALCQALTGDLNLWLDFEFFADPSGKLLWELAASGIATPTGNNINISPDLSFSIPDAKYQSLLGEVDLKTNFIFFGEQSGKLLWELENFNVK